MKFWALSRICIDAAQTLTEEGHAGDVKEWHCLYIEAFYYGHASTQARTDGRREEGLSARVRAPFERGGGSGRAELAARGAACILEDFVARLVEQGVVVGQGGALRAGSGGADGLPRSGMLRLLQPFVGVLGLRVNVLASAARRRDGQFGSRVRKGDCGGAQRRGETSRKSGRGEGLRDAAANLAVELLGCELAEQGGAPVVEDRVRRKAVATLAEVGEDEGEDGEDDVELYDGSLEVKADAGDGKPGGGTAGEFPAHSRTGV